MKIKMLLILTALSLLISSNAAFPGEKRRKEFSVELISGAGL